MTGLRPFFSFYGSKWRAAPRYPAPTHDVIVEPFAGSAGYSLRYPERQVRLYDVDPAIVGVWDYLIHAPEAEIRALPVEVVHVADLDIPQEARWLIGFWLNKGAATPRLSPSSWMRAGTHARSYWGEEIRSRIAAQVSAIRHWTVAHGSYESTPDVEATWFVDPPDQAPGGRHYRHYAVDVEVLGEWCRTRRGQVIACEQEGADWLPFEPFGAMKVSPSYGERHSQEVVWIR